MTIRIIALFGLVALAACETIGGAGQDIENAGEFVQDGAQDVQNDL